MRTDGRESSNVEDRRGRPVGGIIGVGGGLVGVIILIVSLVFGLNPGEVLDGTQADYSDPSATYIETTQEKELSHFVRVVLAETEDVWSEVFKEQGMNYAYPTLVLYTGSVESACGVAGSSTGPFYCPADGKVYIDLSFYDELQQQFHAPGDFAMAYVIAHEVGHHVQNLLGITDEVARITQGIGEAEANQYSVRLELQADYFAGVWAHYVQGENLLEEGDLEEAMNAASAVGDDRIQQNTQGYVIPESFTHGTSEQRKRWFLKGFTSGTIDGGDTFSADTL